ncbi:nitroreductase family protein [Bizionia sediminis]|uniref:Nitroreductase family protein n=1 Tax=Bizionia sediminis TaxID=1737064 RepID=A0ABW5KNZ4_9FLAO
MNTEEAIQVEKIADTTHEIFALIKQRYSPRTFKNAPIKEAHLHQLFEAARWAASSNNLQPWRFIYAEKGSEAYTKLVSCLSDFNQSWATNAPVLMLAAYQEKTPSGQENFHGLHDLGLCLGNMTLQAQYQNIGMHHMAGVDWKKAHKLFKVPAGFHVATAIALGYYGGALEELPEDLQKEESKKRARMPQKDFAFKHTWKEI